MPSRSLLDLCNLGKRRYFLFLVHTQRALNLHLSALNFICCSYSSGNVINLPSNCNGPLSPAALPSTSRGVEQSNLTGYKEK